MPITPPTTTTKKGFLYARVSSVKQKEDLERQKQLLSLGTDICTEYHEPSAVFLKDPFH